VWVISKQTFHKQFKVTKLESEAVNLKRTGSVMSKRKGQKDKQWSTMHWTVAPEREQMKPRKEKPTTQKAKKISKTPKRVQNIYHHLILSNLSHNIILEIIRKKKYLSLYICFEFVLFIALYIYIYI
jgi:hypothetical protein